MTVYGLAAVDLYHEASGLVKGLVIHKDLMPLP